MMSGEKGGYLFCDGDIREVPLEDWVLEVGAVDVYCRIPVVISGNHVDAGLLKAKGHSATASEKVNGRYICFVCHAFSPSHS